MGFGDWNPENNEVIFTNNSNNGDVYKVFGTVLHSIELFFEIKTEAVVILEGSDSQRKLIYRNFLDKHVESLRAHYIFFGKTALDKTFVPYYNDNNFEQILFYKKI